MEISEKKIVSIHYKGTFKEGGAVFDSSEGREPLLFLYGSGMIIPGLEEGLKGLNVGDKKTIDVGFEKGYGPRMDQAKQEVPKDQLPKEAEVKVGMQLMAQGPQGAIPVTITEVKDATVTVDFNHPLAGKDLVFEVEVIDVREPTKEELEHGHAHGVGGAQHSTDEKKVNSNESLEDSIEKKEDKKSK